MAKVIGVTVIILAALSFGLAYAGPVLWIDDDNGNIGTVELATGTATKIGNAGPVLTDIAFDPKGNLWGIDFWNLYSINKGTGNATWVGPLSSGYMNALVFSPTGTLYAASNLSQSLFTINTSNGQTTSLGSIMTINSGMSVYSAGDLAFNGGSLYLSTTANRLVRINLDKLYESEAMGPLGYSNVFGLATADNGLLYGVSGYNVFSVNTATGADTFVTAYSGDGLSGANGTAFITEAGAAVPLPPSFFLLGPGLAGIAWARRRFNKYFLHTNDTLTGRAYDDSARFVYHPT